MRKNITFNAVSVCVLLFAVCLVGCSKKNEPKEHIQTYEEMVAEQTRNQPVPPINPSICKDNSEGYVYFQVGEEIFRYTKDSPIQVGLVPRPELRPLSKIKNTDVPEGCKDNPYTGVPLSFNFKEAEKLIGNFKLEVFGLSGVQADQYQIISAGQKMKEDYFYYLKDKENHCENVVENLVRCGFKNEKTNGTANETGGQYMADNSAYTTALSRPFVLNCYEYVSGLKCDTFYRLYPSVDISYSFFPAAFNDKNIILFDQYIRRLFEDMRVKKTLEAQASSSQKTL